MGVWELAPGTKYHEIIDVLKAHVDAYGALFQGGTESDTVFKRYCPEYKGYYCVRRNSRDIQIYDLAMEIEGTLEAARIYTAQGGHKWGVKDLRIIRRGDDEVVLSYTMVDEYFRGVEMAGAMEVWIRCEDGEWRLLRQFVEQQGRLFDAENE